MDIQTLNRIVMQEAALRRRQKLQPVGGKGDKIFPPTYPGEGRNPQPRHVYERRQINGEQKWCALIDSVQSQANRLEECLLQCIDDGMPIPYLVVDFSKAGLDGINRVTSLDAPHRIYDAILRDSSLSGESFDRSEIGLRLAKAKPEDASAVLELSPTALLFGAWHSTGGGGGVGAKFARCLVSEIFAIDVPIEEIVNQRTGEIDARTTGRRTGSRIDPLGILRKVEVYKAENGWSTTEAGAGKKAKKAKPSEINHGNIAPSVQPLGVTCDYIEHSFVLSFAALRRLRFGGAARDEAGRCLLAALGILAFVEQDRRGYALRSRCDLVCDGPSPLVLVHSDGATEDVPVDRSSARRLYKAAFEAAQSAGFSLSAEPLRLTPQAKLVDIVRQSQKLALEGRGGEDDEAGSNDTGT